MTPAEHAATVRQFRRHLTIEDCDIFDPALDALVALAERATELERERDRFLAGSAYEHLRERAEQLETALREANELLARILDHADAGYQEHLARASAWLSRAALDGGTT